MGRCLSLLGMMVFALGVVALASVARTPAATPAPTPNGPDLKPTPADAPAPASRPSRLYRASFSLN
jgi:hypothetical protein